ncbi:MAG: hypothetical protein L6R38_000350 [Xanthoria sp. 2 TBL-2021]|nr:MAG: hypothetical protein L6R38_000350 [Xanthoria sp. 2 TBL-2021]
MASGHLSIDDFFTRLSSLFQSRRNSTHGSVFLTQKRLSFQSPSNSSPTTTSTPSPDSAPSSPLPILIRASNGKSKEKRIDKIKLSTIVQPDQLEGFFIKYAEVIKGGATALKKRDRSGRKKATKAKKKGKGGGGTDGDKK